MNRNSKEIIATLSEDVQRLIVAHDAAIAQVQALSRKSGELAEKVRSLQQELRESKAEVARLQLGEALGAGAAAADGAGSAAARAQVGRLLREVDKCIDLVSKQI